MRTRTLMIGLAVLLAAALTARAEGNRRSMNMSVSAVVVPDCKLDVSPLSFGNYDPLGTHNQANLDATASVLVTCTKNSQVAIEMDAGRSGSAQDNTRYLTYADQRLAYYIFRDPARSQAWGRGSDALQFVAEGISTPQTFTVYGRIPPAQEIAPGTYNDVVTATIDF